MDAIFPLLGPLIALAVGTAAWAVARASAPRTAANDNAPLRRWATPRPAADDSPPPGLAEATDAAG